ncbi:MAG: phosphoglycerate dehydrogenase [Lachnospiraceae bacterium]|nr:phosphoglycerate dehydrogenase [Lachnospiraceae bacterium]
MVKVVITPRTFGYNDPGVFDLCREYGIEPVTNPTNQRWNMDEVKAHLDGAVGLVFGTEPIDGALLDEFPTIKAISKYGVGIDNVDVKACEERGVKVSRAFGANSVAVADFAFGVALACVRRIAFYDDMVRKDGWGVVTTPDISGKTMGILGLGAIGKVVAKRAKGFDMKVLAYDPFWDADYAEEYGIIKAEPETIFREADFINVHMPLTPETKDFIGEKEIAMMKPTVVIVNCARGGIVNEDALYQALVEKRVYAAGMDVFVSEPKVDQRWKELDNVILSPHAAGQSDLAVKNMGRGSVTNIARDLGLID